MILKYVNGWKNLEISTYNCANWTVAQQINFLNLLDTAGFATIFLAITDIITSSPLN